jgi:hypothetical protein
MHLLFLERGKEAFEHGIVPAVAFATHAAHDAPVHKLLLIVVCRVMTASVAVKKQLAFNLVAEPLAKRHLQGFMHQRLL